MSANYQHTAFLNIPVSDLERSIGFYSAIGFVKNNTFSNDQAVMMSLPPDPAQTSGVSAHTGSFKLMLLTHDFYKTFLTPDLSIPDPTKTAQMLLCLTRESVEEVEKLLDAAAANGGERDIRAVSEMDKEMRKQGFYGGNASDPDGHIIECCFMPEGMYVGKE